MHYLTHRFLKVFIAFILWSHPKNILGQAQALPWETTLRLPPIEESMDLNGFVAQLWKVPESHRADWIFEALQAGYLPDFLRQMQRVHSQSLQHELSFWVMPDYLAIGDDSDYLHVSLSQRDALSLASSWGMLLPTRKMVDLIYQQAGMRLSAMPLDIDAIKDPMKLWLLHEEQMDHDLQEMALTSRLLQAGHMKDLVLSPRLLDETNRAAIYGWQGTEGPLLQNLSTAIRPDYADYSMGVRLVAPWCFLDGQWVAIADVLRDPKLAALLSDEGAWDISSILPLDPLPAPPAELPLSKALLVQHHP